MLNLQRPEDLAAALRTSPDELQRVLRRLPSFCEELTLSYPRKPGRQRIVYNPTGPFRCLQRRLYDSVLLPALGWSPHNHGGIRGRSILTNAAIHRGQGFLFSTDIADFFPSIHHSRVCRLFLSWGCSPIVARTCTRLTTFGNALAQGFVTSPILADQVMKPIDQRIARICSKHNLAYSRFVDDLAISGPFSLRTGKAGFAKLVTAILRRSGLHTNPRKEAWGSLRDGVRITGVCVGPDGPEVPRCYLEETRRQLWDAASLALGEELQGAYYTESQIWGRVRFVCWIDPRLRKELLALFKRVDWHGARDEAKRRGLEAVRTRPVVSRRVLRATAGRRRNSEQG